MNRAAARLALVALVAFLGSHGDGSPAPEAAMAARDRLERHRNLGKAFYENPTTQLQAVDEFKRALELQPDSARDRVNYGLALLRAGKTAEGAAELEKVQKQDPKIPHTWFNLGIVHKKDSQFEKAIVQLEGMARLVPGEAVTQYNLGVLYKLTGRAADALGAFERESRLSPNLAGPHFQLFNAYRLAGRAEEAEREEKLFYALKKQKAGAAVPEDLEWSYYAEIYDPLQAESAAADGTALPDVKLARQALGKGFRGMAAADWDGDLRPDLIAWGPGGVAGLHGARLAGPLGATKDVVSMAAGDFDNDGLADLCVLTGTGAQLWLSRKDRFEPGPALPASAQTQFAAAVWMDFDHDYDLDLFLFGADSRLLRNNGKAGFTDESASFPFAKGKAQAAVFFDLIPDTDGFDLAVSFVGRPGVLYRDQMGGRYEALDLPALPAGTLSLASRDLNNDGATDLMAGELVLWNRDGNLVAERWPGRGGPVAWVDLENRGFADAVSAGAIHRNLGAGKFVAKGSPIASLAAGLSADFDSDGREDLAALTPEGEVELWMNRTESMGAWLRVALVGVKNQKLSNGAEVEVKAGGSYQKQIYRGVPLHFGLRGFAEADTVRITWANGLIQNEVRKPSRQQLTAKEAPRLSGSCPMIFTWNGREFEFVTDVLAVAPLGAAAADGKYFPVDHDEVVAIPPGALKSRNGQYEVRVTEELREVSYIDQVRLLAVEHEAGTEVLTSDKFKGEPFPEFQVYGVRTRIHPLAARDDRGNDVLPALLRNDRQYPDSFARKMDGSADLHALELDFGDGAPARALLVLRGWIDWPDGSTFRAISQERRGGFTMPYLQTQDAAGNWRTVIEDMGVPAGKPKSIVVDLSGHFLSDRRKVRIVTDLSVYWDEIFLSPDVAPLDTRRVRELAARKAILAYRGFSGVTVHPERRQPDSFTYSMVTEARTWNPIPGQYTRYGSVSALLDTIDDRMVVMGAGDELRLSFPAASLPAVPPGRARSFLLFFDGWAKDGDANTAYGSTVEPLPFHGMSAYPYAKPERFPRTGAHQQYLREYNNRSALRLLTALRPRPIERTQQHDAHH